jgi:signal transduction histidine kinase/ligand-binding sensor domain-containing protein
MLMKQIGWSIQKALFLVVLITTLICNSSYAQLSSNNLTWFTEKDGLPGTQVNKILVDRFGYIWIGTINGLARYDGYTFKRFYENPNDPGSIKGLVVWSLFEDSKGQIWVGTQPGKLNVFNPVTQSFKYYEYVDLIGAEANVEIGINSITEDNAGRMYFGVTSNYGNPIPSALLYLDEKEDKIKRFETPDSLAISNVVNMVKDNNGNIWIRSYKGIFKIDKQHHIAKVNPFIDPLKPLLKNEYPHKLIPDPDGAIWIITNYGRLFKWDLVSNTYEIFTPTEILEDSFHTGIMDKDGNIWLGTDNGFFQFDPKTKLTNAFVDESNGILQYSAVYTLALDSFGTLWIGTNSTGMYKYEERSLFKSYRYDKGKSGTLTNGWVNHIVELKNGKILVTTSGVQDCGFNLIDLQNNEILSFPSRKYLNGSYGATSIIEHSPGEVYISSDKGLFQFSYPGNQIKKITLPGIPESVVINYFLKDRNGNQWIFSYQGIYIKKATDLEYQKPQFEFEPGDENRIKSTTYALESDKHGLWILTNDMLFLYDYKTNKINRVGNDKSKGDIFGTQDINSIYEDPSGLVWVGTWQGGLSRFNVESGKIKTYTINDGLPSMSIQAIIADENNQSLWLSTFEGLSRFDIPTEKFYNYSIDEGIQSQLFADGSFTKTSTGNFIFGGSNGITVFDPSNVNRKSIPPKVFLTDFKLFNKSVMPGENSILTRPIYETDAITLAHDQNNISLEFTALHYSNPIKNKYAFKLENYDDDWREMSNFQAAFYPNLPPGEYVFRVKAANNNGVWNEEGATLKILIKKPWWNAAWAYGFYGLALIIVVFAADRYLRYRVIQKERARAQAKDLEQAKEIEKAYTELKSTQAQLIQSEKMASLGELTAGIAHEIQNPLNFVNNFSEVSNELIDEMKTEQAAGNWSLAAEIANDVKQNLEKILHHGKRASDIVKGMLQHSRGSSGKKEPTDINALCDEYLRLSYHGLRAKDKTFNAKFETHFDESLPKINVVPQDIGRVILNLINNAFYAVNQQPATNSQQREPLVVVSTKYLSDKIFISVKDNGNGIPDSIKEKIFQPFFTTKPTGQGTGLGLSLSYDIVKAHGGELKVETKVGEGSEFIINIPLV